MHYFLWFCSFITLFNIRGFGFETRPWMNNFLELHFVPSFLYRSYPSVNGGYNPSNYHSNDRFTQLDLNMAFLPSWDGQMLVEFADTTKQCLGMQSAGVQLRYQFLDDIQGDFISIISSINIRYASKRSLQDVSCPYHAEWNFEIGQSVGKEFDFIKNEIFSVYNFLGVGQANHGRPWIHDLFSIKTTFRQIHAIEILADGYFGFGKTRKINVADFTGYGPIFHQSIDLGLCYSCTWSPIWGKFSFYYAYRVFAKNFPERANSFMIQYDLPFSIF